MLFPERVKRSKFSQFLLYIVKFKIVVTLKEQKKKQSTKTFLVTSSKFVQFVNFIRSNEITKNGVAQEINKNYSFLTIEHFAD